MKRLTKTSLTVAILAMVLSLKGSSPFVTMAIAQSQSNPQQKAEESTRDAPPDTTPYRRPAVREDFAPKGMRPIPLLPPVFIVDPVVNNTDPNLTNTDTFNDGETSITANPANPNEVVVTAFSGGWGANAPLWQTTDGGNIWTKQFTIPAPPGIAAGGCPCDQAIDYGSANQMSGTFLISDIFSGTTTDPASAAAWNWLVVGGVTQPTNFNNSPPPGGVDQPWLLVNVDPTIPAQDNVYTAYDDFTNGSNCAGDACIERVSASYGVNPPNFTADNQSGTATGSINPGHRLAVDPRNGFVYSLFQRNIAGGAGGSKNIDYMLNRSTDGGTTWTLNGMAGGIIVANADSTQPTPKFGTVNALLGGVDHAAVDPNNGDVYYVYGNRDAGTGNNRLALRRIQDNGGGGVTVGPENFVTGQIEAAIPSVAVASNGIVGVFYYSFDGFSPDGFPTFTAHLAQSSDQVLLTFLSSATDNGNNRQRVLGDYMQMKAVDTCFFGAFTGNGVAFGRPFANHDPIFFRVCVGEADLAITKADSPDPVITGSDLTYTVTVTNNGPDAATSVTVTDNLPAETTFVSCSSTGGGVCSGSNNNRTVTFASLASGQSETITFVANVNCSVADGTEINNTATVSSFTPDPDPANNSATATTTASNPPPTITGATADPSSLWPPNHRMVNVTVSYDVTDNCPLPPGSCILSVTSNEPVLGHGSGHTSPDWIVLDDHHVLLRAEREGGGNGRIYTITITCTDSGGNSSIEQVEVTVPHDRGRR